MDNEICTRDHMPDFVFIALLLLAAAIGFVGGLAMMDNDWKKKTVKEGRAKWTVVGDDGNTKWEWIPK